MAVTAPVTRLPRVLPSHQADAMQYLASKHIRMRFAYGIGKDRFEATARAAGAAQAARATRRK